MYHTEYIPEHVPMDTNTFETQTKKAQHWNFISDSTTLKKLISLAWVRVKNYTDRRFSAKLLPNMRVQGATWSAWRFPTAVFSDF
jgi:hypothetical protein